MYTVGYIFRGLLYVLLGFFFFCLTTLLMMGDAALRLATFSRMIISKSAIKAQQVEGLQNKHNCSTAGF